MPPNSSGLSVVHAAPLLLPSSDSSDAAPVGVREPAACVCAHRHAAVLPEITMWYATPASTTTPGEKPPSKAVCWRLGHRVTVVVPSTAPGTPPSSALSATCT